jgi:hypothetical protein
MEVHLDTLGQDTLFPNADRKVQRFVFRVRPKEQEMVPYLQRAP